MSLNESLNELKKKDGGSRRRTRLIFESIAKTTARILIKTKCQSSLKENTLLLILKLEITTNTTTKTTSKTTTTTTTRIK